MEKPELVLPAGTLEKLITAFNFGADAVYVGGKDFSLRAYAGNLTLEEISKGLEYARSGGKKVYVGVNVLAHNHDINRLPGYLEALAELRVDGLIISDPGVLRMAQKYAPGLPVTISTQANVSNYEAAAFYRDLGAVRIVLARELTLSEIKEIKQRVGIEIEVFVHGAMCVSYSGRCLLSYYMTGRSANQGACAHPCRYKYSVVEEKRPGEYFPVDEDERGTYIFNSRDLCLLPFIPQLIDTKVDAFKVEGRMKSPLYVAVAASVYRQAIDCYLLHNHPFSEAQLTKWSSELNRIATRPYTTGFMTGATYDLQDQKKESVPVRYDFCGMVKGYDETKKMLIVEQRQNFGPGDNLEVMIPGGQALSICLTEMYDEEYKIMDRARHARQTVLLPFARPLPEYSILRRLTTQ